MYSLDVMHLCSLEMESLNYALSSSNLLLTIVGMCYGTVVSILWLPQDWLSMMKGRC